MESVFFLSLTMYYQNIYNSASLTAD